MHNANVGDVDADQALYYLKTPRYNVAVSREQTWHRMADFGGSKFIHR
jgi:hypothetical protein